MILGAPWAVGNDFAFLESIFRGIAVDKNGGRAFTFGGERFESAIAVGIGIADEDDFTFHVDALLAQKIVIFGIAAVGVDQRSGDFSGGRHAAPRRADAFVFQVRIAGDGHFPQHGAIVNGRDHFERSEFWIASVNVVAADDDIIEAFLSPLIGDVAGQFVVARRTGNMRLGGEKMMLTALLVGGWDCFEFCLDLIFACRRGRSEAQDGSLSADQ